jgi:hypothetical protein
MAQCPLTHPHPADQLWGRRAQELPPVQAGADAIRAHGDRGPRLLPAGGE